MSQYLDVNEIGDWLLTLYHNYLSKSDPYCVIFSELRAGKSALLRKTFNKMESKGLVTFEQKDTDGVGRVYIHLTEKGKLHGSELKRVLDNLPHLR